MPHPNLFMVSIALGGCPALAIAQWTDVKDVNGKVHTVYKTPVRSPTPAPKDNTPTYTPSTVKEREPVSSSGSGGYAAGYNASTGSYSFRDAGDELTEGFKRVYNGGKYGFINQSGKLVIPLDFSAAQPFSGGLAGVSNGDKYGFIYTDGTLAIPYQFDRVEAFASGMAPVLLNGKWGFVDVNGKLVIPCTYDRVGPNNGLICVQQNGMWGFVDQTGKAVIPCIYEEESYLSADAIRVKLNGKYGFLNQKGKVLVPIKYDRAYHSTIFGSAQVEVKGEWEWFHYGKKRLYK